MPQYKGLCVFDIDNTLTRGAAAGMECNEKKGIRFTPECNKCEGDRSAAGLGFKGASTYPGAYAKEAIRHCREQGYAVGVATYARCAAQGPAGVDSRLQFLSGMGLPHSVVSRDPSGTYHKGPALMCYSSTTPNKGTMVKKLMDNFSVSPSHTVFFDDQKRFLKQVKPTHAHTQLASSSCHGVYCPTGCGLTKTEFKRGMHKVS
eukprot:TRINITY_DN78_c2_g1_i2.p1 TRINITY_DN78_c2_g1~~TRINITY_DN78_c2_g1_i2.p1  ORF type:complete len:204 (+),score=29.59 TRINITY_DN78_c2_g1_i2:58-669(+)